MFDFQNTVSSLDQALSVIGLAAQDPARLSYLKTELSRFGLCPPPPVRVGTPPPLPAASTVTAAQVAIFDNGSKPYGGKVEVWDTDEVLFGKNANYHAVNVTLLDRNELKNRIRGMTKANRATKVDPDYIALLTQLADGGPKDDPERAPSEWEKRPNTLIGLMHRTVQGFDERYDAGSYFFANQFMLLEMVDGKPTNGRLLLTDDVIKLGEFVPDTPKGKRLAGNIIAQSRTDLCGFDKGNWATNVRTGDAS